MFDLSALLYACLSLARQVVWQQLISPRCSTALSLSPSLAHVSCVAVWQNGRVEICANDQGNRITPSFVAWTPDGQRLVGDAAKNQVSEPHADLFFFFFV